jgi:hypothetical protein
MCLLTRSGPALRSPCRCMRLSAGLSLRSPGCFMSLRSSTRSALRSLGCLMCLRSPRPAFRSLSRLMRFSTRPAHRSPGLIRTSRSLSAGSRLSLVRTSSLRLADRSPRSCRASSSRPAFRGLRLTLARRSRPVFSVTSLGRPSRATRRHYASAGKLPRLRSSRNRRPAMVHRSQHRVITPRCSLMLRLRRRHPHMRIPSRRLLRCRRTSRQPSAPAVIAHPAHRPVIHRPARINVRKAASANPVHRAVVVESSSVPVPTLISNADISKPIIDAAIEAHRRPPITRIP